MVKAQLLFALSAAAHQDRIYRRLQGHEMQREMQHAAAGVRSGLAALRHHVLVPTGQFFGGDATAFFRRAVCAAERGSTKAHRSAVAQRHIGAACWLVTARLYNLKRPKSQFYILLHIACRAASAAANHWQILETVQSSEKAKIVASGRAIGHLPE
jgi:hypothetical protein